MITLWRLDAAAMVWFGTIADRSQIGLAQIYCVFCGDDEQSASMETKLRLLTRDGALGLCFRPKLTPQQYDQLLKASTLADSRDELREAAKKLAIEWHSALVLEE